MKAIYFAIFYSYINYANFIWGWKLNSKIRIITLHKKALRIINNQPKNTHKCPLFKKSNILKVDNKIVTSSIIFISKSINNLLPSIFKNWFIFCSEIHNYDKSHCQLINCFKSSYRTDSCGKNSIIVNAINCWNKTQNMLGGSVT